MLVLLTREGGDTLRRELTQFGRCVFSLMATRGITTQKELSRRILKHAGESVSADAVRNYLYARSSVPPDFPGQLVRALDLDHNERARLAMAFSFGQTPVLVDDEREAS